MLTPFEQLSPKSRVWIYQADRVITKAEQKQILSQSEVFIEQWAAHGESLLASASVMHDHFLIIATDEGFNLASGCSIDSSFRFVQELGSNLNIGFFERTNLAFSLNKQIELVKMNEVKEAISTGKITSSSKFFDNNVQTKSELLERWIVNASESWLKRYFPATTNVI